MRVIWQIIGFVMLFAGLILTITPVPFSTLIAIVGASLIIANNRIAARWLHSWRIRFPAFDRAFEWIEQRLPESWRVDGGSIFEDFSNSRRNSD
jgi:hypothetical protein